MPIATSGINVGFQSGIRLGIKPSSGGGGDPLDGIPFALRLQTHAGFGATPNATTGLFKPATIARVSFPINATASDPYKIRVSTNLTVVDYAFSASDPGGVIYLGPATGVAGADATTFTTSVLVNQPELTGFFDSGSGNTFLSTVATGSSATIGVFLYFEANTFASAGADISPATQDGDAICEWHDVLGTSGLVATQSNTMKQPVLRITGGVPWVEFGGTAYLTLSVLVDALINANKTDITIFSLFSSLATAANVLVGSDAVSPNRLIIHPPFSNGNTYFDVGDDTGGRVSGALTWDSFSTGTFRREGSQMDVWKDGVNALTRSDASGTYGSSPCYIGSNLIAFLTGKIVAVLVTSSGASTMDRETVEAFLPTLAP